ncbi:hypothetical protein FQR65_LT06233 [Abscondita terminalis]|nr:hypothetical protein FQR65_LT06233 [Abscondita terminalis]
MFEKKFDMDTMTPELRAFGPADNPAFYQKWLGTDHDPLFHTLFLSAIDHPPYDADYDDLTLPTMSYLAWYGRHLVINPGESVNRANVLAACCADLMGPLLPTNRVAVQGRARSATAISYVAADEKNLQTEWDAIKNGTGENNNITAALKVLKHLAEKADAAFKISGVSMIVHVYLAVLKRSSISEESVNKISIKLSTDLKITNFQIDFSACRKFSLLFRSSITENTVEAVTAKWINLLPISASRLRFAVQRAAGSGLTALIVTGRAILIFVDFNWAVVMRLYPDEWDNLTAAVRAVGNNAWYPFRNDLGVAASTKYRSISYVAKELLIQVNGETSLKAYAGWVKQPKLQAAVDKMIASYVTAKTTNTLDEASETPSDDALVALRTCIRDAPDVYV